MPRLAERFAPGRVVPALGLLAAGAVAGAGLTALFAGGPAEPPAPPTPSSLIAAAPLPPPPLTRAEILAAARRAASAHAAGVPDPSAFDLVGRRFELQIPFGCPGAPDRPAGPLRLEIDAGRKTLKASVLPQAWPAADWAPAEAGEARAVEAVEGFWAPRPWLEAETCPALPASAPEPEAEAEPQDEAEADPADPAEAAEAPPAAPVAETLGLAVFHETGGSRVRRRGERPFEVVRNAPADPAALGQGLRLALAGRVTGRPGAGAFLCRGEDPDRPPVCLLAVEFDRVAIQNPIGGEAFGEWRY